MSTPEKPGRAAVKDGLAKKMRPHLRRMDKVKDFRAMMGRTGEVSAEVTPIVVSSPILVDRITKGLSPKVVEQRDEYLLLFENLQALIRMKTAQCVNLAAAVGKLEELEFITGTSRGRRALDTIPGLRDEAEGMFELDQRVFALIQLLNLSPNEKVFLQCDALTHELITRMEKLAKRLETVAHAVEAAIEDEAIKAWVEKNPDTAHEVLEHGLWVTDQIINGVEFAGETLSDIPNEYTKATGLALTLFARVAKLGKVVIGRQLIAADAERQMANYRKNVPAGEIFDEHDKNPDMMAQMLVRKTKDDMELIMVAISTVVETAADQVPGLGTAWGIIEKAIKETVEAYLQRRLDLADELRGVVKEKGSIGEDYLAKLGGEFKDNIFKVLNPFEAMKDAAISLLAQKIAETVMKYLPVQPAQMIDGSGLMSHMNEIHNSFMTQFHRKGTPEKPRHTYPMPTEDSEGNTVVAILSGMKDYDTDDPYVLAKVDLGDLGVRRGTIMLKTLVFDGDAELGEVDKILLGFLPETDSRGRPVDEVRLEDGLSAKREGHVFTKNPAYYARIGDLWGFIDQPGPNEFHPVKPDLSAFGNWSNRTITGSGYREGGTEVAGTWHRPWQDREYYVFVPTDGSPRTWALGAAMTARGGSYNVRKVLNDGAGLSPYTP
jgi:hypothetical protein